MWARIFDKVYVVSLPQSEDRRSYVKAHLAEVGITDFEWHDACGPDHSDVRELMSAGKVHQYPPCFRCGELSCGKDDCNNVLIPHQIAVFATYLRLWKKIAATPQRALIVEDDVQVHDHAPKVLAALSNRIAAGTLDFVPDTPRLLRLGWALCGDHTAGGEVTMDETVKMSNPCHAMTSAYAQTALDRFKTVYHTADVFLHRDVPQPGQALSVYPPLASELSWSTGAFSSLIHPKNIRADYLERQGHAEEAKRVRALAEKHARIVAHRGSDGT